MDYRFISTPYNIDRKLYKYFSNIDYAIDSINNRRIHLDDPICFNDPFDATYCIRHFRFANTVYTRPQLIEKLISFVLAIPESQQKEFYGEILKALVSLPKNNTGYLWANVGSLQALYKEMGEVYFTFNAFEETIDQGYRIKEGFKKVDCKISCFSEVWNSILMWAYYANNHHGVCIEYDISRLDMKDKLNKEICSSLSRVHYTPIRADNLHTNSSTNALNFLTTKADVWAHEHEWRIVCESTKDYLPFDCVSNVYLGISFNVNSEEYYKLRDAVDTYDHLEIHKCIPHSDKYQIEETQEYNSLYHNLL